MTNWPFVIQLYTSFRVSTSEVKQELRAAMRASILGSNICHMCFAKGTVIPQPFASQATTYNTPTIKDSVKWLAEQTFRHIICTACLMNKLGLTLKNCTVASCHAHTHTGSSHYAMCTHDCLYWHLWTMSFSYSHMSLSIVVPMQLRHFVTAALRILGRSYISHIYQPRFGLRHGKFNMYTVCGQDRLDNFSSPSNGNIMLYIISPTCLRYGDETMETIIADGINWGKLRPPCLQPLSDGPALANVDTYTHIHFCRKSGVPTFSKSLAQVLSFQDAV